MKFVCMTDDEFQKAFVGIVERGSNNNTYKFALARFLLEHSNRGGDAKVRYAKIARSFFRYYWMQECKSRLRQGPKKQKPVIITIIRKEFGKEVYPYASFTELVREEGKGVNRCVSEITKMCFDDVIPRFQTVGRDERRVFFEYYAKEYKDSANNKKVDPGGGILLNPDAMEFMRRNYVPLMRMVTLAWMRFLERLNFGIPNLARKLSDDAVGPRDQGKYYPHLSPMSNSCFYCGNALGTRKSTHVDHVIPYDYVGDTEMWNLVLACQRCNCTKLGSLPPHSYIDRLAERNELYRTQNEMMERSMHMLSYGNRDICWHYCNAINHGYPIIKNFPVRQSP